MRGLALVAGGLLVLGSPVSAASRPTPGTGTFRLEHALTIRTVGDFQWSPDGRRLAFVVTSVDTAENSNNQDIWLSGLDGGAPVQLTRHPKADLSPTFSPGGDTLAFVGNRGTGEDAKSAIYMMSLSGGEPWAFGSYQESVGEVAWSLDGRYLAFVMTDTLPKQVREWRKKKWDHVVEEERLQYPHLWVVEIATGKKRRLTSGKQYVWYARWSPDSRSLAFLVSPTGKPDDGNLVDIGVVPVEGGPVRKLGVIGTAFAWSPDGNWISWAGGAKRDVYVEKSDLWVVAASGGKPVNLTADFDEDAETPAWNPTSDTLFFHSAQGVTTRIAAVPRAGGPVRLGVDLVGAAGAPVVARDGRIAWVESQPTAPSEVWAAERAGLAGRPVSSVNAEVSKLRLGSTRAVRWTSTDGTAVEGLLVRPPGASERGALKTLVLLHGGPYTERFALAFQALPQYFAAHGYQVFMPNFRSSGGYGTAFMVRRRSDWGGQDWRDVTTGVDSLVRRGLADPNRLGIFGHSYGGYLTAWAITQTTRFDAACVSAGAVDLGAFYGQSDIQKYRAFEFQGAPWETPENWTRSSPITYIKNARTPTLILVGEDDRRVPYPQAQQLFRALTGLRVQTEFVHYPREGHGVREPRHRADQMMRMLAWWDRWIR